MASAAHPHMEYDYDSGDATAAATVVPKTPRNKAAGLAASGAAPQTPASSLRRLAVGAASWVVTLQGLRGRGAAGRPASGDPKAAAGASATALPVSNSPPTADAGRQPELRVATRLPAGEPLSRRSAAAPASRWQQQSPHQAVAALGLGRTRTAPVGELRAAAAAVAGGGILGRTLSGGDVLSAYRANGQGMDQGVRCRRRCCFTCPSGNHAMRMHVACSMWHVA